MTPGGLLLRASGGTQAPVGPVWLGRFFVRFRPLGWRFETVGNNVI